MNFSQKEQALLVLPAVVFCLLLLQVLIV